MQSPTNLPEPKGSGKYVPAKHIVQNIVQLWPKQVAFNVRNRGVTFLRDVRTCLVLIANPLQWVHIIVANHPFCDTKS